MVLISCLIQVSKIFCVADTRVKTFIHAFHITFSNLLIQKTCGKQKREFKPNHWLVLLLSLQVSEG